MPTAPSQFRYYVEAYEVNTNLPDYDTAGFGIKGVKFTKTKQVYIDSKIIYRITIRNSGTIINQNGQSVTVNGQTLTVTPRVPVDSVFSAFKNEVKDFADVSNFKVIDNLYFDFTVTPKGTAGTVDPKFTPQLLVNSIWADVLPTASNAIPGAIFTKKNTAPQVPDAVKEQDEGYIMGADDRRYEWNSCSKEWVRIWLWDVVQVNPTAEETKRGLGPKFEVFISAKYFDELGFFKREVFLSTRAIRSKPAKVKDINYTNGDKKAGKTGWTEAKRVLLEAKNCETITTPDGGPGAADPGSVYETVPANYQMFNPPPHSTTRPFNPVAAWPSDQYTKHGVSPFNQLGVMYTDPSMLVYKKDDKGKFVVDEKKGTFKNKWGFRFLYNPTTWSYTFGQDNSGIDWSRGNENGTILVAGTGAISLQLLIDRVADMNAVRTWDKGGRVNPLGLPYYPYQLTEGQMAGILYRGTEYDLEYFYRVLNNDLVENPLFGSAGTANSVTKGLETLSANLGYVTSLPFILKLNDQLRYKVIFTGLTVNHDIFTKEMIPTRTVLNLSLERIPDWFYDKTSDKEKRLALDKASQIVVDANQSRSLSRNNYKS